MKKIILPLIVLLIGFNPIKSQQLQELDTIDLTNLNFKSKLSADLLIHNIEFRVNKKSLGKFNCYYVTDILEETLKNIDEEQRRKLVILIENKSGDRIYTSYTDFDKEIIISLPLYIIEKDVGRIGDTVKVHDVEGMKGVVNLEEIAKEFRSTIVTRIFLNIEKIKAQDKKRLFKRESIIIPQDKSIKRWISNVVRFRIFKIID
jgi:hypothetical protein